MIEAKFSTKEELMRTTKNLPVPCLILLVFSALSGQAFSTTVAVGSCTSLRNYATIQQAVNAVPAGSIIKICPGTYREQVVINQKLTLTGIGYSTQDLVVILPPSTGLVANAVDVDNSALPIAAQILVENTSDPVVISNLTVDGTGNGISGCAPDLEGILFQNASGTLNHVAVRNETLGAGLGGCQSGQGIFVQTASGLTSVVTVENSSVHDYNKNGITGHDAGTTLTATANYVQGAGVVASGGAAQNGIEIAFGAAGKITGNTVIDNIYGDPTIAASADILLYDAAESSGITVSTNVVGNSQLPIAIYTDTPSIGDGVSVIGNKIFGTAAYDAIDVCTNGNTIKSNTIFDSAESGVHFDASCGSTGNNNTATGNTFVESHCAGILTDNGTSGNTIGSEIYDAVPFTITSSISKCTIPSQGSMNQGNSQRPTAEATDLLAHTTSARKVSPAR
jgi:parallel beta-helix repeat protein